MQIAIYMRLSKEDALQQESSSISNQRMLLLEYAARHFPNAEVTEFADDGYSGTSFERPGVQGLLKQVRNAVFECIIVKDFSRFSRDYIELGTYLECIFPLLGVRFISINDGYDSGDDSTCSDELGIALKGLLYDLYSKDLSVKVKSALTARRGKGEYVGANCPFGYCRAKEDRHKLIIKEDEAAVVREIFALALQGLSLRRIAEKLWERGVKTPAQFRENDDLPEGELDNVPGNGELECDNEQALKDDSAVTENNGVKQENDVKWQPAVQITADFKWQPAVIGRILTNPVYTGDMVYGKTKRDIVGGKSHLKPREEWQVYQNHHAPIIEREVFEQVRRMKQ